MKEWSTHSAGGRARATPYMTHVVPHGSYVAASIYLLSFLP
jgi:hypothetical protein